MKKYSELTPEQKRSICNGCGGKGGFVKPPHRAFFKTSCNHHDYKYWQGGTKKDRAIADKLLYSAMVEDCSTLPLIGYLRYRPWCWAYYLAVRAFGWKFFSFSAVKRGLT